ncbi:MAG: glycosyltransferase family 2 protein, partial [Candidatus Levybacteria bacterium]|nr:glycosyltransferase family 2 protein [Candidatus Levybacteria bacterium]
MNKLSVVISAFNEEKKIRDCLKSASFADEIIFIDNSSTDNTVKIAKEFTSKIFKRENNLMLNVNKNYGFTKAINDWILCLDADERVTPELAKEIKSILDLEDDHINGYWIPRKNMIFGKWIKYAGWYPDHQLRLFKKDKGKFEERHVHEMIKLDGEVDYLKENLIHYNFETVSQFLHKHINIYAQNEAEDLISKGYVFAWTDAIRFPFQEFLSRFFAREGYKEGVHGLIISMLMAFYHLVIFTKIWEMKGFKEVNSDNFFDQTEKEFEKVNKDINYWFLNE